MKKLVIGEEKCAEIFDAGGRELPILEIGWFYWIAGADSSGHGEEIYFRNALMKL